MNKNEIETRITEYLRGELTPAEAEELLKSLPEYGYSQSEINDLRKLYVYLDDELVPEASASMDDRFYDMLYSEKRETSSQLKSNSFSIFERYKSQLAIAASIALFILGWFGGVWFANNPRHNPNLVALQQDLNSMKQLVILSGIKQSSPTERIKAVNMTQEINTIDNRVIEALIKTLNEDENDNVRLVALEALKRYANYPEVRQGLIESIAKQTSPLIQLELANTMVELREKKALPYFEDILKDKGLNYSVRKKMDEAVKILI